jgi:hypothetical protein
MLIIMDEEMNPGTNNEETLYNSSFYILSDYDTHSTLRLSHTFQ